MDDMDATADLTAHLNQQRDRLVFSFAGPTTEKFLARGFQFHQARPDRLSVHIFPRPGRNELLAGQAVGETRQPGKQGLKFDGKIAIPLGVKRGARGRVPKRLEPTDLLAADTTGRFFTNEARTVILERQRGRRIKVLYVLASGARITKRFRFYEVLRETAIRQFPKKAARVLEKINLRRSR